MTMAVEEERAEWTLALRQVFQDVQLQAVEASGYVRNPTADLSHQRTLVPAVRRLNALFSDEVGDGKRGVAEEAFLLFLEETWLAVARVLLAAKADVALQAVGAFMGEFLRHKSREPKGKSELRAELLQRLAHATQAEDRGVRLRACHMLQLVVDRLDGVEKEQATMLREALLRRLRDKLTAVRIQSVYGLKTLQGEEEDAVAVELRKLMVSDPSK
jgi:condensin complex subunit 3